MKAPPQVAAPTVQPPEHPPRDLRAVVPFVVLAVVAATILAFYLSIFRAHHLTVPIGWDSSEYLWRTRLAQDVGLANIDRPLPMSASPKAGRPALPVVLATLSSLFRVHPIRLEMVLSSVLALVIGLAAGAFVAFALGRPVWDLAAVALGVALSPFVVRMMTPEGYLDTMLAAGVFLVAAMGVALAIEHRAAVITTALLLGAGAVMHFAFFGYMAATLALTGILLLPASWYAWRKQRTAPLDTPTARIGESVVGGAAVGAVTLFGILGNHLRQPRLDVAELTKKLRNDLSRYHFRVTIPAAAVGAASLGPGAKRDGIRGGRTTFTLAFLVSWCALIVAGYLGKTVLHRAVPAHRLISFGLALPVLGVLAMLWIGRFVGKVATALGVLVVMAGLAAMATVSHTQWFRTPTYTNPQGLRDVGVGASYLEATRVPVARPVVFIVYTKDYNGAALMVHTVRAGLPADRIPHAYVYVGTAEDYLAQRPEDFAVSRTYFRKMQATYGQDPVAIILADLNPFFDQWTTANPNSMLGFRAAVVTGPPPPRASSFVGTTAGTPVGPMSLAGLVFLPLATLLVLLVIGLGWSLVLFARWVRGRVVLLAIAPAVGVAALVPGGIVIDRLGLRLTGVTGALTPLMVAAVGWALATLFRLRRPRPSSTR